VDDDRRRDTVDDTDLLDDGREVGPDDRIVAHISKLPCS